MSLLGDTTKGSIFWENPDKKKAVNCPECGRFMKLENTYEDVFLDRDYYWSQWNTYKCEHCKSYETKEIVCREYKVGE